MPANLENTAVTTGLEKVSFHSNPKDPYHDLRAMRRSPSSRPWRPDFRGTTGVSLSSPSYLVRNPNQVGGSIPPLCLKGIPDLPGTPQDEAGLTRKFER